MMASVETEVTVGTMEAAMKTRVTVVASVESLMTAVESLRAAEKR